MKSSNTSITEEPIGVQALGGTNPPLRILVVDDDEDFRRLNAEVLIRSGYVVDAAEDGAAGWEALNANSYDLLVTDNSMPRLTGVELIKKLRTARMALPVIMATGTLPTHEFNRKPWLIPDATLLKPFTGDELLDTVRKVLRANDTVSEQVAPPPHWQSQPSADGSWQ